MLRLGDIEKILFVLHFQINPGPEYAPDLPRQISKNTRKMVFFAEVWKKKVVKSNFLMIIFKIEEWSGFIRIRLQNTFRMSLKYLSYVASLTSETIYKAILWIL